MSKRESKRRLKRRSKGYRRAMMCINIIFIITISVFAIYGFMHTFTKKKEYRDKGLDAYNSGEYDKAVNYFDKAYKCDQWFSDRLDVDILFYKADCQVRLGEYEAANDTYSKLRNYPKSMTKDMDIELFITINNAYIDFENFNYADAVEGFIKIAEVDGYESFYLYAGICYENMDNYEAMYDCYCKYEELVACTGFICYKNASYNLMIGDYDQAISYVERGKNINDSEYLRKLEFKEAEIYEHDREFEAAFNTLGEYLEKYDGDLTSEEVRMYQCLAVTLLGYDTYFQSNIGNLYMESNY